ncbi:hypothetical protein IL306_013447 [Fusarium sp. DS 682]|nr:hypothetical protein IL306_013447 [Fusarium sp. DS 682]
MVKGSHTKKGDLVYVHFSGHGARATTVFQDLRTTGNAAASGKAVPVSPVTEDQSLVPCDILYGGSYLRDLELAVLLQALVEKGLVVTVVLDCCHAGGAVRGDEQVRGIEDVYRSDPGIDTPINMTAIRFWANQPSWLYEPQGFVVLAACLEQQKARERSGNGVLTKCLLEILRRGPLGLVSQALYNAVYHKVQEHAHDQMPYLVGDADRFFFNETIRNRLYGHTVIKTSTRYKERSDCWVQLDGGSMHGVERDSIYTILPRGSEMRPEKTEYLARVRVTNVNDGNSFAVFETPEDDKRWSEIVEGCQAVLHSLPVSHRSTIWFDMTNELREKFSKLWHDKYVDRTWLGLADSSDATFQVSVNDAGHFVIHGQLGAVSTILGTAFPSLSAQEDELPSSMPKLIRVLEHLARYKMTKDLVNHNLVSRVESDLISVSVEPAKTSRENGVQVLQPASEMKVGGEGTYEVQENRLFCFTVRNLSDQEVHFAIFNCAAEFAIAKMYPPRQPFKTLEARGATSADSLVFYVAVADELQQAVDNNWKHIDTFKIFASSSLGNLANSHSLQLQALSKLDLSFTRGRQVKHELVQAMPHNLGEFMGLLDDGRQGYCLSREPEPAVWQTVDVKVQVIPGQKLRVEGSEAERLQN